MTEIQIEDVKRLDVQAGDVLLVTVPPGTTQRQADDVKNRFETILPVRAVVMTSGVEVEVAREVTR